MNCNPLESIICMRTLKVGSFPSAIMRIATEKPMNTSLNSKRLVQPIARILRQLLSGFTLATAVRENLHAAMPDESHGSWRAALGLRPAVKHPRNPAHPDRLPTSRSRQEATPCPAPPQGAVWRQLSSSHNKERAGEANPLTSANSPDRRHRPRRRTFE